MSRSLIVRKSLSPMPRSGVALPLLAAPPSAGAASRPDRAPPAASRRCRARRRSRQGDRPVNGVDITEGDLAIAADDPALQLPQRAGRAEARPSRSAT